LAESYRFDRRGFSCLPSPDFFSAPFVFKASHWMVQTSCIEPLNFTNRGPAESFETTDPKKMAAIVQTNLTNDRKTVVILAVSSRKMDFLYFSFTLIQSAFDLCLLRTLAIFSGDFSVFYASRCEGTFLLSLSAGI
jgi:hypothetical protein